MVLGILTFVMWTYIIALGIHMVRQYNYFEKWKLVKMLMYGAMCSAITLIILYAVVILF